MKIKLWPSFTMIEMLVSLTLYFLVMTGVVAVIGAASGIIGTYSRDFSSRTSVLTVSRILESIARETVGLSVDNDGSVSLLTLRGSRVVLSCDRDRIVIRETGPDGAFRTRELPIKDADKVHLGTLGEGGKSALTFSVSSKKYSIDKSFLISYLRSANGARQ